MVESEQELLKRIADGIDLHNNLQIQKLEMGKINTESNIVFVKTLSSYLGPLSDKGIQDIVIEKVSNLENKLGNFVINNVETIRNLDPVEWRSGVEYKIGEQIKYKDNVYLVVQNHTSQDNWTPNVHHTGFVLIATSKDIEDVENGECPEFVQPTAQTVYNIDDCVVFKGKTYVSLINSNGWSPEEYPTGWKQI